MAPEGRVPERRQGGPEMTAAAPRTASGAPDLRRVGVALGALTLAVALLVTVAVVRPAGGPSAASSGQGRELIVNGTNGGAIRYTGIPTRPPAPTSPGARSALPGSPIRPCAGTGTSSSAAPTVAASATPVSPTCRTRKPPARCPAWGMVRTAFASRNNARGRHRSREIARQPNIQRRRHPGRDGASPCPGDHRPLRLDGCLPLGDVRARSR